MINFYKTTDGKFSEISAPVEGCWVKVINPNEEEIRMLTEQMGVDVGFIKSSVDEEETSRVDSEENQALIIIDTPLVQKDKDAVIYSTIPLGIIAVEKYLITISLKDTTVLTDFTDGFVKNVDTARRTQFILHILFRTAVRFLQYLKQIDKIASYIERQLHLSMKNKELIQLLDLQKSLVYFSTSLKANEKTLEKIQRGRVVKLYDEDQDLLDDAIIELKQAIEMSDIYSNILTGTSDAFASIISNNLNIVMKTLTILTIIMSIPTMIFSFYGMNVDHLPFAGSFIFPLLLTIVVSVLAVILLFRKKLL